MKLLCNKKISLNLNFLIWADMELNFHINLEFCNRVVFQSCDPSLIFKYGTPKTVLDDTTIKGGMVYRIKFIRRRIHAFWTRRRSKTSLAQNLWRSSGRLMFSYAIASKLGSFQAVYSFNTLTTSLETYTIQFEWQSWERSLFKDI